MSMLTVALALDDRALAVASEGRVRSVHPSIVHRQGDQRGLPAIDLVRRRPGDVSARHWRDLRSDDESAASLVAAELQRRLLLDELQYAQAIWLAVGAAYTPSELARILGVTNELKWPVIGFVDAAVATVAALALDRPAIVLEMGMTSVGATLVDSGGELVRRRRGASSPRGGFADLQQAWLDLISQAMVKRTRFDPLHDAVSEQALFDSLPTFLDRASADAHVDVTLEGPHGEPLTVRLARDQFAAAGAATYGLLESQIRDLRTGGMPVTLVVPEPLLRLPGLSQRLDTFAGCDLLAVPEGFAAAAASCIPSTSRDTGAPVRLLRRLPRIDGSLLEPIDRPLPLGSASAPEQTFSHVLFEGRATPLGMRGVVIGRAGNSVDIALPEGLAGVSRRHCTFMRESDGVTLVDHSRHGTFVNGERVAGRLRVRAGDRVRLGEPGVELALICVGVADGAPTTN